jgi:hypothetical protein
MIDKKNLTIREYAEAYGPKRTRVFQLIKNGELDVIKDGRRTYITAASAERRQAQLEQVARKGKEP